MLLDVDAENRAQSVTLTAAYVGAKDSWRQALMSLQQHVFARNEPHVQFARGLSFESASGSMRLQLQSIGAAKVFVELCGAETAPADFDALVFVANAARLASSQNTAHYATVKSALESGSALSVATRGVLILKHSTQSGDEADVPEFRRALGLAQSLHVLSTSWPSGDGSWEAFTALRALLLKSFRAQVQASRAN